MATEKDFGFVPDEVGDNFGFVPDSPTRPTLQQQYPKMGVLPAPTLADRIQALNIGGLESLGRLPGELATAATQIGVNQLLSPISLIPGSSALERSLNQYLNQRSEPIQNLTPKAFNTLGTVTGLPIDYNDPNAPQNVSPNFAAAGEIGLNAALLRGGGPIRGQTLAGALTGNLGRSLETPTEALLGLVRKGTEKAAKSGVPVANYIANKAETMAARGLTQPVEDAVTRAIGIEPINGGVETFQNAKTAILRETGKLPTRDVDLIDHTLDAAKKTQTALLENTADIVDAADKAGLVIHGEPALAEARSVIQERFPLFSETEGAIDGILSKPEFANIGNNIPPPRAKKMLTELNTRYESLEDKNTPEAAAYRVIRNYMSNQLDGVIQVQSGQNINPFREWGQVQEFKDGLRASVEQAQGAQAGKAMPGSKSIPVTPSGAVKKIVKGYGGRLVVPREIEEVTSALRTGFNDVPTNPPSLNLNQEQINSLLPQFQPITEVAPTLNVPPPNLEKLIQTRMKNASPKVKKSGMARMAAIQDLKDTGALPPDYPLQ